MIYLPIASSSLLTLYSALFCSTLLPESPGASLTFGRLQADPLGGSGGVGRMTPTCHPQYAPQHIGF